MFAVILGRLPNPKSFRALSRFLSTTTPISSADAGTATPTTGAVAANPILTPQESKLVDGLFTALLSHHRSTRLSPSPPPVTPDLTLPSLTSSLPSIPPPHHLSLFLLSRLSSLRPEHIPFPQTLSFFNSHVLPSATNSSLPSLFSSMVSLSSKAHHFPVARHLLNKMLCREIPISRNTLLSLLRRYVRADQFDEAINLFADFPDYGIKQDANTLASLIAVLSKKRRANEAQQLFDCYKESLPPDVVTYSALVHVWCRSGRIDQAEKVFAEMHSVNIAPNVYTYTMVIDALCRVGQLPRAQELLCQMIDARCLPNTATFNAIMRAHVKAGRTKQVLQVNNQMRQIGCEPDLITYNFLIETHCGKVQQNMDAALKLLNQMVTKGVSPDCHSFNPLFRCALWQGNVEAAHKLHTRMAELGCAPNVVTYNLLIQLFNKDKSMDMVLRMKKEMDERGIEPNINTYSVFIEAFCRRGNWRRAHSALKEMVTEKFLRPKKPVYQMVLTLLMRVGQLRKHEELVEMMVEHGFMDRTDKMILVY